MITINFLIKVKSKIILKIFLNIRNISIVFYFFKYSYLNYGQKRLKQILNDKIINTCKYIWLYFIKKYDRSKYLDGLFKNFIKNEKPIIFDVGAHKGDGR